MSLIADALKAAQGDKSRTDPAESPARRVVAASVLQSRAGGGGAFAGVPVGVSPPLKWAAIGLGGALIIAAAVIYLAPSDPASLLTGLQEAPVGEPAESGSPELPFLGALTPQVPAASQAPPPPNPELDALLQRGQSVGVVSGSPAPAGTPEPEASTGARPGDSGPAPGATAAASRSAPLARPVDTPVVGPVQTMGGRFELAVAPAGFSAEDLMAQGASAHRSGDYSGAVQLYSQVLGQSPTHLQALNNIGIAYQAMGDLPRARDAFQRVISLDQRNAGTWSSLGAVFGRMGEVDEAMRALGEAVLLDPSNTGAKVNLANHHLARGFPADARRLLEGVVLSEPNHAEAHYNLGRIFDQQGDRNAAVRHYRSFLDNSRGRFPAFEITVRERIALLGSS